MHGRSSSWIEGCGFPGAATRARPLEFCDDAAFPAHVEAVTRHPPHRRVTRLHWRLQLQRDPWLARDGPRGHCIGCRRRRVVVLLTHIRSVSCRAWPPQPTRRSLWYSYTTLSCLTLKKACCPYSAQRHPRAGASRHTEGAQPAASCRDPPLVWHCAPAAPTTPPTPADFRQIPTPVPPTAPTSATTPPPPPSAKMAVDRSAAATRGSPGGRPCQWLAAVAAAAVAAAAVATTAAEAVAVAASAGGAGKAVAAPTPAAATVDAAAVASDAGSAAAAAAAADTSLPPDLWIWDGPALAATRSALATPATAAALSPEVRAAVAHLRATTADDAAAPVRSVTAKAVAAPGTGGDRRVYVSLMPYAWPCNGLPAKGGCVDYVGRPPPPPGGGACNAATGLPWVICDGQVCVEECGAPAVEGQTLLFSAPFSWRWLRSRLKAAARRMWMRGGATSRESGMGRRGGGGDSRLSACRPAEGQATMSSVHSRLLSFFAASPS